MELIIFSLGLTGMAFFSIDGYYKPRIVKIHWLTVLEFNGKEGRKRVILF